MEMPEHQALYFKSNIVHLFSEYVSVQKFRSCHVTLRCLVSSKFLTQTDLDALFYAVT